MQRGSPIRGDSGAAPDVSEFDALYRKYRRPLFALCLARLQDEALAEDVMQDAFVKAFSLFPRFDPGRPFWPWLASIAAHECINTHRRRGLGAARHAELAGVTSLTTGDSTSRTAFDRITYDAVTRDIATLPPRQRAALELFALDNWSYADIAERFGCSVGTIKLLIVRARHRLRRAHARVWSGVAPALRSLALHVQRPFGRVGALPSWSAAKGGAWPRGAESVLVMAILVVGTTTGQLGSSPGGGQPGRAARSGPSAPAAPGPPSRPGVATFTAPPEPVLQANSRAAQRTVHEAAAAFDPDGDPEQPEGQVLAMDVSPRYETDHTIFAWGAAGLLVTRDGGASWSRLRGLGLQMGPRRLLLPPAYPSDARIFTMGFYGLQMSDNGGDTFETIMPGSFVDAAFSPGFGAGDPTILLATGEGALLRHDGRSGVTAPVVLDAALAGHTVAGVRYDGIDPSHRTFRLLSILHPWLPGTDTTDGSLHTWYMSECTLPPPPSDDAPADTRPTAPMTCTTTRQLHGFQGALGGLDASALGTGVMVVRGSTGVLVSTDGGRHFRSTTLSAPEDIAVVPRTSTGSAVVARHTSAGSGGAALLRTDDGGRSWQPLQIDLPGFAARADSVGGAWRVALTPTGRIIAAGYHFGLACSVDGGRTWAPSCPTPDA